MIESRNWWTDCCACINQIWCKCRQIKQIEKKLICQILNWTCLKQRNSTLSTNRRTSSSTRMQSFHTSSFTCQKSGHYSAMIRTEVQSTNILPKIQIWSIERSGDKPQRNIHIPCRHHYPSRGYLWKHSRRLKSTRRINKNNLVSKSETIVVFMA